MLSFITIQVFAQQQADWKTPVEGNAKSIFFHQFTQTPIVETSLAYYGMDPQNKTTLWTIKKPSLQDVALQTIQSIAGTSEDIPEYMEIPYTQFAVVNNNLIDIANGTLLLGDGKNPFKIVISNHILPELNLLLLQVGNTDNSQKLYAIDLATDDIVWDVVLAMPNIGKDVLKFIAKANGIDNLSVDLFAPCTTKDGNIIYNNNGKLILINGKTGAIVWENACNPGTFFMNEDQSQLFVIEKRSSISNMISIKGPQAFTKKVFAIDPTTGKNAWQEPIKLEGTYKMHQFLDNKRFILANEDGLNLYETGTGKKIWKKDIKTDNLKSITMADDGLEILFGNKLSLIDPATGKKLWKKPIELKDVDEKSKFDFYKKEYKNSRILLTDEKLIVYDKAGEKKVSCSINKDSRIAFDNANAKIMLLNGKSIYLIDPDNTPKKIKPVAIKLEKPREITGYKMNANGYFIYGDKEYIFIDPSGKLIAQKSYPQLKTDRLGKAILLTTAIASATMGIHGTVSSEGEQIGEFGVFVSPEAAKALEEVSEITNSMYRQLRANEKQRHAVRSDEDQAYFMQGIKDNEMEKIELVVVDKTTGKEVKNINFSNDRKVIYEVDPNNNMLYYIDNGAFNFIKL